MLVGSVYHPNSLSPPLSVPASRRVIHTTPQHSSTRPPILWREAPGGDPHDQIAPGVQKRPCSNGPNYQGEDARVRWVDSELYMEQIRTGLVRV